MDRSAKHRPQAPAGDSHPKRDDEKAIAQGKFDESVDHAQLPAQVMAQPWCSKNLRTNVHIFASESTSRGETPRDTAKERTSEADQIRRETQSVYNPGG